jgi:hypothetical protein
MDESVVFLLYFYLLNIIFQALTILYILDILLIVKNKNVSTVDLCITFTANVGTKIVFFC